jgi:cohesin loading factor subunit SCC2
MGTQARYASTLITLTLPFGGALPKILNILVTSMMSQQPTLRSRSLKSVSELLSKDKTLLNRNKSFIASIIRCTQDKSSQVRDSALLLLAKCLILKPELEGQTYAMIIALSDDESIMVRKHAMKILKEIYLRNSSQEIRAAIAAALMQRVKDLEESVSEIARQTFEELWIAPFRNSKKDAVQTKLDLENQVSLIAKTTQRGGSAIAVLETLLQTVLSPESKLASANFQVCKDMVAIMFDGLIDNETPSDRPSQQHLSEALSVFAKSEPKLFRNNQLRLLQPYLTNLNTTDNLPIYNSAVIIFSHVLPSLPSVEHDLLKDVADALVQSINKITKTELPDTVQCLWVIRTVLKDPQRVVRVMMSLLMGAHKHKDMDLADPAKGAELKRVGRYIEIAGWFGKICNFDEQAEEFRARFPFWTGKTVSGLIVDLIYPFTRQKYPRALRETALESIATVCQGWPQHYLRSDVSTAFELVFHNHDTRLEHIVLTGFLMFFHSEEKRSETGAEIKVGEGKVKGQERLSTSFLASDNDAGATTIAQKFLPHVLRIALASTDDLALTATQVIASISRQGLVHPKECGPALVALETSTNKAIADAAYEEHKIVHTKHESMFEKEYMKAVQQAFKYQQEVLNDPRGVTLNPVAPKLKPLFEILKTGTGKVRKRFLSNICARIDFELPKLDIAGKVPAPVLFARFVLENLAFFDYARVDELLHLVSCLEKMVVHGTGTVVAHAIELEILKVQIVESSQQEPDPSAQLLVEQPVEPARVRHLAIASAILSMVWECRTHLRHLWGLQRASKVAPTGKNVVKDLNKAPTRTPFVSADKHLDKISAIIASIETTEGQLAQCKLFAELLSVDNEVRVADEEDEEAELARQAAGYDTPDEDADALSNPGSAGGSGKNRKRKTSVGVPGTPSAKRRKVSGTPKKRSGGSAAAAGGRRRSRAGSSASADADGDWD